MYSWKSSNKAVIYTHKELVTANQIKKMEAPLAERIRPQKLDDYVSQSLIL
jgi:replication-associated recombination protein RarA